MLADEYVLIVPFAYQLQSGLKNKSQQKNITSTSVNLLGLLFQQTSHRIPAHQKALSLAAIEPSYIYKHLFN